MPLLVSRFSTGDDRYVIMYVMSGDISYKWLRVGGHPKLLIFLARIVIINFLNPKLLTIEGELYSVFDQNFIICFLFMVVRMKFCADRSHELPND